MRRCAPADPAREERHTHDRASPCTRDLLAATWQVGYPLDYELVHVPAELNLPGHSWAEPSTRHLRALMRGVFEQPDEAARRGAAAAARMRAAYSPEALADEVASHAERIGALLRARRGSMKTSVRRRRTR